MALDLDTRATGGYPADLRGAAGVKIVKTGLRADLSLELRDVQKLPTAPAGGLVPVQDPDTGLLQVLDLGSLPTAQPGDGTVGNVKLAASPPLTLKGNATAANAQPQDVAPSDVKALLAYASQEVTHAAAVAGAVTNRTARDAIGDFDISLAMVGSLANAVALTAKNIRVPAGSWAVPANLTVPPGLTLTFERGATLAVAAGVTLTIRCLVVAPCSQIFTGLGRVVGISDVRPEWWGALANGTADDQPALQAAHDCVELSTGSDGNGAVIRLRGGNANYGLGRQLTLRPTAIFNLQFSGCGAVLGTRFTALASFTTALGPAAIRIQGTTDTVQQIAAYRLGNFSVAAAAGTSASVGVWVGGDGTAGTGTQKGLIGVQANQIHDVYVVGFSIDWRIANCRLIDFNRCSGWTEGVAGVAALLITVDTAAAFTGDLNFNSCQFIVSNLTGTKALSISHSASSGAQVKGVRFNDTIFYHADRTVEIYAASGATIGDVWFNPGCQLDGFQNTGFYIEASGAGSVIDDINILTTYIRGVNSVGINIAATSSGFVTSINIQSNWISSLSAARAILVGPGVNGVLINGNTVQDCVSIPQCILINSSRTTVTNNILTRGAGASGVADNFISLGSGTDYCNISGNNSGGYATAPFQNLSSGTHNIISPNI